MKAQLNRSDEKLTTIISRITTHIQRCKCSIGRHAQAHLLKVFTDELVAYINIDFSTTRVHK